MPEFTLPLADPDATSHHARLLATRLDAGDVILLSGDVGAGKTHFARALIGSLLIMPEDIPSPTFTLVQTYASRKGEIWHTDLYRITSVDEIEELGLVDAFDTAICLVEWPEHLGPLTPASALTLRLTHGEAETERKMNVIWRDAKWEDKLAVWRT